MEKKKACVLFKGFSQYDVLRFFLDEFEAAFKKAGYVCYVVDAADNKDVPNYFEYLMKRKSFEFIFSINGQMVFEDVDGRIQSQNKLLGVTAPFVSYMVDSPLYHYPTVAKMEGISAFSFVDKTAAALAEESCGMPSVFIPHGACLSKKTKMGKSPEKTTDLFFAGTFTDENALYNEAKRKLDAVLFRIFEGVVEYMSSDYGIVTEDAVPYVCNKLRMVFDADRKFYICSAIAYFAGADAIIRSKKRTAVLNAISDSGAKMTICGSGWEKSSLYGNKNFRFLPALPFEDTLNMITESKVTLNVLPLFPNGSHERAFAAMANGSVSLSDTNIFFEQNFTHNKDILFYSLNNLEAIGDTINSVLTDQDLYDYITSNAKRKVMRDFSFEAIAEQVLDLVRAIS